jgi:hypothetical protein
MVGVDLILAMPLAMKESAAVLTDTVEVLISIVYEAMDDVVLSLEMLVVTFTFAATMLLDGVEVVLLIVDQMVYLILLLLVLMDAVDPILGVPPASMMTAALHEDTVELQRFIAATIRTWSRKITVTTKMLWISSVVEKAMRVNVKKDLVVIMNMVSVVCNSALQQKHPKLRLLKLKHPRPNFLKLMNLRMSQKCLLL